MVAIESEPSVVGVTLQESRDAFLLLSHNPAGLDRLCATVLTRSRPQPLSTTMTTPAQSQSQTPVSGVATPPVPHGVGNPSGTPVVAPTRTKDKDGASGSLGTFGVRNT